MMMEQDFSKNMMDVVVSIHEDLEKRYMMSKGILNPELLESAVTAPFQTFFGEPLYKTVEERAARLCYGLTKNHSFHDGNKRIGLHAMLVYLNLNKIDLKYTAKQLEDMVVDIATDKVSIEDLTKFIKDNKVALHDRGIGR